MAKFNRVVAIMLWLVLLVVFCIFIIIPQTAIEQVQLVFSTLAKTLTERYVASPANFMIAQAAFAVLTVALFGLLLWLEVAALLRPTVTIHTAEGGRATLEAKSIGQRLGWQLDQVDEIQTVVPIVKSRGGAVNVKLEIEATAAADVTTKTDEIVEVTRDLIEQDLGLKLGKLDVQMRTAPFEVPAIKFDE